MIDANLPDTEDAQHYWKNVRNLEDAYLEVTFDTHKHPIRKYIFEKMKGLIESFPDEKKEGLSILELGCGTGPNLWLFKDIKELEHIYASDFDCKAIDFCKKKFESDKRFKFSCGDLDGTENLYKNVFFDVVLISGVFSTMNEQKFAKKIQSVLNLSFDYLMLVENHGAGSERLGDVMYHKHNFKEISGLYLITEETIDKSVLLKNLEYFFIFRKTEIK